MLGNDDWLQMQSDLTAIKNDHPISITIRRGDTTLAPQTVRIARTGPGSTSLGGNVTQEGRGKALALGGIDFDVQPGDRFNAGNLLYQVVFVRPNRDAAVVAEIELIE